MHIIYISSDEKIRDGNMVAKEARIFDQVMLIIFVHFIYIVENGKIMVVLPKVSIRVYLLHCLLETCLIFSFL